MKDCGWPQKLDNLTWCKKPVKLTWKRRVIVAVFTIQHPERHFQMMIDDFVFSNPFQRRHQFRPSVFLEELLFVRKGSFFAMSSKSCSS